MSKVLDQEEFLKINAGLVYNLALRLTGNATDAEDLAQDALLRALKALPGFRGDAKASSWLYRIVLNTWKNWLRARRHQRFWKMLSLNISSDEKNRIDPPSNDPPLDCHLEIKETTARVQDALLKLDAESRAVIVLREIEGLAYQDIAEALQIPEGTVKSRLSRARDTLREILQPLVRG